uniref:Uncharacterized protein n=1 Tax=Manihot esculenta TaxID=3983 RepID=A0A2C9VZB0_MANES
MHTLTMSSFTFWTNYNLLQKSLSIHKCSKFQILKIFLVGIQFSPFENNNKIRNNNRK